MPTNFIMLNLITPKTHVEEHKSGRPTLYNSVTLKYTEVTATAMFSALRKTCTNLDLDLGAVHTAR